MFKAHPYLLKYFPAFQGLSDDELRRSPGLKAHATSVMYGIKSYVGTIDDPETLAGLVTKMATSHVPRGVTVKDLEVTHAINLVKRLMPSFFAFLLFMSLFTLFYLLPMGFCKVAKFKRIVYNDEFD